MIVTWDNAFGVLAIFGLSYAAIRYFDDTRVRVAGLALGFGTAALLAGFDPLVSASSFQSYFATTANQAGFASSTVGLSLAPIVPTSAAKRTVATLGASGIASSLLGFPSWIVWLIVAGFTTAILIASYKVMMRLLSILEYRWNHVREGKTL